MSSEDHVSIQGTLLMLDDATPHVAVPVQVMCNGKVMITVLSDERGGYQFTNLKPGQYQLRCQVLGGYVYYKAEDTVLRVTPYESCDAESSVSENAADIVNLEVGKTLRSMDFHFAPFKKGTWRHYTYFDGLAGN